MNTNGWNTSPDVMNVKSKKNCFLVLLAGGGELITAAVYVLWSKINGQAKSGFGPVSYSNLMRAIKINITCLSNKEVAQTVLGLGFLFSQTFSGFEGGENGWFFKGCLNMIDTLHPARNSSDLSSVLNLCRPPAPLQEWPQWIRRKKKKEKYASPSSVSASLPLPSGSCPLAMTSSIITCWETDGAPLLTPDRWRSLNCKYPH